MSNQNTISLTASELGYLWTGYSINEMSIWYLTIFREQSNDEDIKNLYRFAIQSTIDMLLTRKEILTNEGYPIPVGFCETDIDESSPPLFTNRYMLNYLHNAARLGLDFHSKSLALATRVDICLYHKDCLTSAIQLYDRVVDLLLTKGIYLRTPTLPTPISPEDIQKTSYLNGWFGETRPMNSMEIANLYSLLDLLIMMETLITGFVQTTKNEEIIELFHEGVKIVKKQYNILSEFLKEDELPIPPTYSAEITNSKKRVFSDRIMVSHIAGLFGSLLSQYGFSLGSVMKHDLVAAYTTQIVKTGVISEKYTKFLIEREWLEKVPGAISRK
ncbi:DUF3231 family protein [Mesobacillus maritimus]|uniref:DUF3231 family protein n=1 Tax=Mesobacillus maritimus TaxID=1643336 RepID=UPI00203EDC31|nr:DUF3231 family protein [Mesobacillus maritimus]MCM3672069.1 DUF3231 family protein [Mesobacillus maritimus]